MPNRTVRVAAGVVIAATALSYSAGDLDPRLPMALSAGVAAGTGCLVFAVGRSLRRALRRGEARDGRMRGELNRLGRRIGSLENTGGVRHAECLRVLTRTGRLVEGGFERVGGQYRALEREIGRSYAQFEAFTDLRSLITPRAPLPALRGWAASPDVLRVMTGWILRTRPKTIVECGSGSSSVWLGYVAERTGAKVVALEHEPRYAEASRDLVRAHGLSDVVEIRDAPLLPWWEGMETYLWYDREALTGIEDVGLVFVDGPPGTTGPAARYPALPLLLPRCSEQVAFFLDDAAREDDKAVSDRWASRFPEVARTTHPAEKGLDVFVRGDA
ncbi:class I SAM-dependent methyltransferase [Streptosporangium algeriense]|uniref:Class I SAM-dependent methyltransferase n=1 Tax=Streptosporangium algeriense TaxID=1682748 RepID=A0ABW3DUS0_9ACTN